MLKNYGLEDFSKPLFENWVEYFPPKKVYEVLLIDK